MNYDIVIDGYNLIRQSDSLLGYENIDLELGREQLINMLRAYKKVRPNKMAVVFDGWESGGFSQNSYMDKGIRVIFSKRGVKADEVIKKIARESGRELIIVTSDLDIKDFAEKSGNVVISSKDFMQKMEMVKYMDMKGVEEEEYDEQKGTKKKGNPRRLPKKERRKKQRLKKL